MGLAPFLAVAAAKIPQTLIIVVRAASAGTLLSLALVHILPEASHKLEAVTPYPLAGTLLAVGVFLSYAVQLAFHRSPQDPAVSLPKDAELGHAHPIGAYPIGAPWAPTASPFPPSHGAPTASPFPPNGGGPQCCSYPAGTGAAPSSGDNVSSDKVVILSMEAGCIVHSVIIGLALGLAGEYNTAAVLLAVLSIHQFLEGLCLGYLVSGLASQVEKVAAVVFTTLSVPVGIIAGLLVSLYGGPASNDTAGSHPALAIVQCLAGGLLLYTTLTSLVAEDLKREDVLADWRKRLAMGVSFLLGMATMSGVAAGEAFGGAHGH
ncbi:ZIP zinc transporter-domain-containing protein [Baffinella frigidus]|nr:ZIP zinc transporter-domain-containing protein [Cryptophyta sp. CCMP2293]